jgi:amino acid transporter
VTSGAALSTGGPASLIIAYGIIGILMFCTVQALGEMAVLFPVAGSFSAYSTRFLDPAWGFAMGWKYVFRSLSICTTQPSMLSDIEFTNFTRKYR